MKLKLQVTDSFTACGRSFVHANLCQWECSPQLEIVLATLHPQGRANYAKNCNTLAALKATEISKLGWATQPQKWLLNPFANRPHSNANSDHFWHTFLFFLYLEIINKNWEQLILLENSKNILWRQNLIRKKKHFWWESNPVTPCAEGTDHNQLLGENNFKKKIFFFLTRREYSGLFFLNNAL